MGKIKIAVIQVVVPCLQVDANIRNAEKYIREAAKQGAQIICLPEAFNTGYYLPQIREMLVLAETLEGKTITTIRALAKELKVWIITPIIFLRDDGRCENTAFILDDKGNVVGNFPKTHLLRLEEEYFVRGTNYTPIETPFGKIASMICYDISFPEVARLIALNGADIIFVPSAWQGMLYLTEWWDRCLAARGLDNQLFIVAANQCGLSSHGYYAGNSKIVNPRGDTVIKAGIGEEMFVYEIDTDDIEKERAYNTSFFDRRPSDYGPLAD